MSSSDCIGLCCQIWLTWNLSKECLYPSGFLLRWLLCLIKYHFVVVGVASVLSPSHRESPLLFIAGVVMCVPGCVWYHQGLAALACVFLRMPNVSTVVLNLLSLLCLIVREVMLLVLLLLLDIAPFGWKTFRLWQKSSWQIGNQILPTGSINLFTEGI